MTVAPTKFKETEIGTIPEGWDMVKVADITEKVAIGPFGSSIKVETFVDEGMPVISGQHLHGTRLEDGDYNFVTLDHAEKLRNSIVFRGDVIFTHAGNIGQVAYIPSTSEYDRYIISQRQFYLRCNKERLTPEFITYFFKAPVGQHLLLSNKSQTGVPSIAQPVSHLRKIDVLLPPLNEQKQIAEILSSLDDKIELNRKINANLEKLAAALFKKWFVDVGEELPEGWRIEKLSDVANISIGRTPPRMEKEWFSENLKDVKWISIRDLGNLDVYVNKTAEYLTREAIERFNIPVIPKNTVILSFKLTVGRVAITTEEMLSNEAIAHIKLTDKHISPEYIYLFLNSFDFSSLASTSSIATAVNSKSVKEIPITISDEKTGNDFTRLVEPIFESILENTKQIDALSQIRDSLLPRLMGGKIRVKI